MSSFRISWVPFLVALLCPALASAATAFEHACFSKLWAMPAASVTHVPVTTQPGVRQVSSAQLTREGLAVTSSAAHRQGKVVVGLTTTEWRYELSVNMVGMGDSREGFCYKPVIRVELSHAPLNVAVGSEFKPNSCAYRFIEEHEREHVRLYQEFLPQAARTLEGTLGSTYANIERVATQDLVEARRKQVYAAVEREIKALVALSMQRHQRFDEHDRQHLQSLSCVKDIQAVVDRTALEAL